MRKLIFAIVFFCPPFLKNQILRWFCKAKIGHKVYIGWFSSVMGQYIELGDYCQIRSVTLIHCNGEIKIGAYSAVSNFNLIYGEANFVVGEHCYIGPQCLINACEDVRMGNVSALGPRCMIYTHGSFFPYTEGYWVRFAPVIIGDHTWIASGVFIHPGVTVGSNVFVNSMSVLTQDIPDGAVIEGFPAKQVFTMDKLKKNMTPKRVDTAVKKMLKHFGEVVLERALEIKETQFVKNQLIFKYHKREYCILCITSDSVSPSPYNTDQNKRFIFLVNMEHWSPPSTLKNRMVLDFTTMSTHLSGDKIYVELLRFMKSFYGIQFEYY